MLSRNSICYWKKILKSGGISLIIFGKRETEKPMMMKVILMLNDIW